MLCLDVEREVGLIIRVSVWNSAAVHHCVPGFIPGFVAAPTTHSACAAVIYYTALQSLKIGEKI